MDNGLTDADEAFEVVRDDLVGEFLADIEGGHLHRPTHASTVEYSTGGVQLRRAMTVREMVEDICAATKRQHLMGEMIALVGKLSVGPTGTAEHLRAKVVLSELGQVYGQTIDDYAAEVAGDAE